MSRKSRTRTKLETYLCNGGRGGACEEGGDHVAGAVVAVRAMYQDVLGAFGLAIPHHLVVEQIHRLRVRDLVSAPQTNL